MSRILAILAHHNKESLNGYLYAQTIAELEKQGHTIDVLHLYDRAKEIPFYLPVKDLETYPFFLENKQRFLEADGLLIVFPVYCFAVPGILKCWLDLLGAQLETIAKSPKRPQKVFVVSSSGAPAWYLRFFAHNNPRAMLSSCFRFMKIAKKKFYHVGMTGLMNEKKALRHKDAIIAQTSLFFGKN
jgi:putative NADPH-quinone reductase